MVSTTQKVYGKNEQNINACHNHDFQTSHGVAARESKAVRRSLIDKLEECSRQTPLPHRSPKHYQKLYAGCRVGRTENAVGTTAGGRSPKVDFADRVSAANGILIGNFQRSLDLSKTPFSHGCARTAFHGFWCAQKRTAPAVH